jgi:hypothetical protein
MMRDQFRILMKGDLAPSLTEFREWVGLQRRGRLSDDWDQEFGRREVRSREQGWVNLALWRGFEDDEWMVTLKFEKDPLPAAEAEQLRQKVLDAAAAVGMTITAESGLEWPKPGSGESCTS